MTSKTAERGTIGLFSLPVIVGALGYFVDVYDILLFSAVRTQSLRDIGVAELDLISVGVTIINLQLIGMILGGAFFGMLGDKIGRVKLLFASILTYSAATFGCAFVQDVATYAALRFIAGFGLAGELGLALTLVSELMDRHKRGYGNTLVAAFGVTGVIFAGLAAQWMPWRDCYLLGGIMGLMLLILRVRMAESFMLLELSNHVKRGNLWMMFANWDRIKRFMAVVFTAGPCLFATWLMGTFAPEVTKAMGLSNPIKASEALIVTYIGIAVGELFIGYVSQKLQTRRKVLIASLCAFAAMAGWFLFMPHADNRNLFLAYYAVMGATTGYFVLSIMIGVELFGTNLRATAGTMAPNLMRATFVPMSIAMTYLKEPMGLIGAVTLVAAVSFVLALWAASQLRETYGIPLDYVEK